MAVGKRGLGAVLMAVALGGCLSVAPPAGAGPIEAGALKLINQYRTQHGRAVLTADPRLRQAAMEHSRYMARRNRLSHDDFRGRTRALGFDACSENVAWNYRTAASLVTGWRNSRGHDANLLDPRMRYVGVAQSGPYVTFIACS